MRRARTLTLAGLVALCFAGCGVPNEEHQRVSNELAQANQKLVELNAQVKDMGDKFKQVEADRDLEKSRATGLQRTLDETTRKFTTTITDLQGKLRSAEQLKGNAEATLKKVNEEIARLRPLVAELAKAKDEIKSLTGKVADLEKRRAEVEGTLKNVQAELDVLKKKVAQLPGDVGKYLHVLPDQGEKKGGDAGKDGGAAK